MKISGFTIVRNAIKYNYPIVESIKSILSICDEFIVNVGDSEDDTLGLINSINNPKLRIIQSKWNMAQGKEVLSHQTNLALKECTGDWAFYLQSDEVIHEDDLPRIQWAMHRYLKNKTVDCLRFKWLHFYGSYFRYRVDSGWYQKQDRIIRNSDEVISVGDAYAFERKDKKPIRRKDTFAFIYHYGWVHSQPMMTQRRVNAETIGFTALSKNERVDDYCYGNLNRFPIYFGTHPAVMKAKIKTHEVSQQDYEEIRNKYWWSPLRLFKIRYKTWSRVKEKL